MHAVKVGKIALADSMDATLKVRGNAAKAMETTNNKGKTAVSVNRVRQCINPPCSTSFSTKSSPTNGG